MQTKKIIINTIYRIILNNTKTALGILACNIQLQYLEIKGDVFHDQYPKVKIIFFIYSFFQVVFKICFFKSILFADQMT